MLDCTTYCIPTPIEPEPMPELMACGFAAPDVTCPEGTLCRDNPYDACDARETFDCPAVCLPLPLRCGFAAPGVTCPEGTTCRDDPSDTCDPAETLDCTAVCL